MQFAGVAEASPRLREWHSGSRRVLILTGDLPTMAALYTAEPTAMHRINLGGLHHRPGRRERLPYLYLTDDELRDLRVLEAAGAEIQAQDLPTTTPVPLRSLP